MSWPADLAAVTAIGRPDEPAAAVAATTVAPRRGGHGSRTALSAVAALVPLVLLLGPIALVLASRDAGAVQIDRQRVARHHQLDVDGERR